MSKFYKHGNSIYNLSKLSSIHIGRTPFYNTWFVALIAEKSINYDLNIKFYGEKQYINRFTCVNKEQAEYIFKSISKKMENCLEDK